MNNQNLTSVQDTPPTDFPALVAISVETLKLATTQLPTAEPDRSDRVRQIAAAAGTLSPVERDTVLAYLKNITGIGMGALRAEAALGSRDTEPDHLALARATGQQIGHGNVIQADGAFWLWQPHGVWNRVDDKAIKQRVQATLEARGHAITSVRVNGVTDVFRNDIFRADHEFNIGDPETINCLNCEVFWNGSQWDWTTHRREHYRTTQLPICYDPTASAPLFWSYLHDVFCDDADGDDKVRCVLEMVGYTLMAHAKHEKFVLLVGNGANGKSVLLSVIAALVGRRNVAAVQPSQFGSKFQRAHLYMKLANIVTELPEGQLIADAELKAITSGELTTVEEKGKDPFDMAAFATCWFGTNHMPHTRDFSDALFRRAVIIRFNRTFAPHEQDHLLKDKLDASKNCLISA